MSKNRSCPRVLFTNSDLCEQFFFYVALHYPGDASSDFSEWFDPWDFLEQESHLLG